MGFPFPIAWRESRIFKLPGLFLFFHPMGPWEILPEKFGNLGTMEPVFSEDHRLGFCSKLDYDSISLAWWSCELDTEKILIKYSSTFKDVKKLSLSPFGSGDLHRYHFFAEKNHGPRAPSPSVNSRPKAEAVRSAMSCDAGNFASRYDSHVMWYIHMMYVYIYILLWLLLFCYCYH